jgi:hypothetical protein
MLNILSEGLHMYCNICHKCKLPSFTFSSLANPEEIDQKQTLLIQPQKKKTYEFMLWKK